MTNYFTKRIVKSEMDLYKLFKSKKYRLIKDIGGQSYTNENDYMFSSAMVKFCGKKVDVIFDGNRYHLIDNTRSPQYYFIEEWLEPLQKESKKEDIKLTDDQKRISELMPIIIGYSEGKKIEMFEPIMGIWIPFPNDTSIAFSNESKNYRFLQESEYIIINGFEVPRPAKFEDFDFPQQKVYYPSLNDKDLYNWDCDINEDDPIFKRNMAHKNKDYAIIHAKALLNIVD